MMKIAGQATDAQLAELDGLLANNVVLQDEYNRLADECQLLNEVLPLAAATQATEGEFPEWARSNLKREVEVAMPPAETASGFKFWALGLGLSAACAVVLLAVWGNGENPNEPSLNAHSKLVNLKDLLQTWDRLEPKDRQRAKDLLQTWDRLEPKDRQRALERVRDQSPESYGKSIEAAYLAAVVDRHGYQPTELLSPANRSQRSVIVISVKKDGSFKMGDKAMKLDQIGIKLKEEVQKNPDQRILVRSDGDALYKHVAAVVAAAKSAGIREDFLNYAID